MKGASIFISVIVLLAIMVALLAIAGSFFVNLTESEKATVEEKGETALECGTGILHIESVKTNGNIKVTVENLGKTELSEIKIVAYNDSGSFTYEATPSSVSIGSKVTLSSGSPSGTLKKIKVTTKCSSVYDEYDLVTTTYETTTALSSTTSTVTATTTIPCGYYINFDTYLENDITSCTGTIFYVNASSVTLDCQNHYLQTTGNYSINNTGFDNVKVKNCNVNMSESSSGYAVYYYGESNYGTIENNSIDVDGIGIYLYNSSNNTLFDNDIYTNDASSSHGIYLYSYSSDNKIINNEIDTWEPSSHGIYLNLFCDSNNITGNDVNTELNGANCIYLKNSSHNTIAENKVETWISAIGIWLEDASEYNNVTKNNISMLGWYGVYVEGSGWSNIMHNEIEMKSSTGYTPGIYILSSSNSEIYNNTIENENTNQGYGVYFQSSSSINMYDSTVRANGTSGYGVYIYSSSGVEVKNTSVISPDSYEYYIRGAGSTNSFRSTNFTAPRQIYFYDNTSWFNYNNATTGGVWLNTSLNSSATLTRGLIDWTQTLVQWNDTAFNVRAQYNLSGLSQIWFDIYDNENYFGSLYATGGKLNFSIDLSGEHIIRIEPEACFLAGTRITMADGSMKFIEDVEAGDSVLSYNPEERKFESSKVLKTFRHEDSSGYFVINGVLHVTPNHLVYSGGWKRAGLLQKGDTLFNGRVHTIEKVYEKAETYNLEVDENHDYFAEGFLVHNK